MFWGLIMEPGRCYTQKVKSSFHVSMASLDISNSSDDPIQVMCVFEGRNYLLCTLNKKDSILDRALDLNFKAGTKVSFATNGKGHVHLTGYLVDMMDDDDIFDEEDDEEYIPVKDKKRAKKDLEGPPNKKAKGAKNVVEEEDIEEEEGESDSEDDEEEEDEDTFPSLVTDDVEEEEDGEEEESDEEEDSSSLSSDGEPEEMPPAKQNGIAKTNSPKKQVPKEKPKKQEEKPKPKKTVVKGGVVIEDIKEGTGAVVKGGKVVHVYYEGRFKTNNKLFDSTTKGPGFKFRVGKGEVIKGWDFGVVGMKVGGKRRITCPPKVAYGAEGSPPVIPPNSTLVFDVEVKKIS